MKVVDYQKYRLVVALKTTTEQFQIDCQKIEPHDRADEKTHV